MTQDAYHNAQRRAGGHAAPQRSNAARSGARQASEYSRAAASSQPRSQASARTTGRPRPSSSRPDGRQPGATSGYSPYSRGMNTYRGGYSGAGGYSGDDASRFERDGGNYGHGKPRKRRRKGLVGALIAIVAIAVVGVLGYLYWWSLPVDITVDGTKYEVSRSTTVQQLVDQGKVFSKKGNLLAVDGSLITENGGDDVKVAINGKYASDYSTRISENCTVTSENGDDVTEDYTAVQTTVPYETQFVGKETDSVTVETQKGADGVTETRTGAISGKTADVVVTEKTDRVITHYYPNTNGVKLVALTFDDGPWPTTTEEILDVLAEYNVHATFFNIGNQDEEYSDIAAKVANAGHQVCSHSYDHAAGSGKGVNLDYMTDDEIVQEIQKGFSAIEKATGKTASTVIRAPGGNMYDREWLVLEGMITAEIGWDIDTEDWTRPGADTIAKAIESATPGDIILCHDGGGDRSQTVEAIKTAIPYLQSEGYTFVTIDELLAQSTIPTS